MATSIPSRFTQSVPLLPLFLLLLVLLPPACTDAAPRQQRLALHPPTAHTPKVDGMAETIMADKPSGSPLLGDIIPLDKQISIFSGLTRSVESISQMLADRAHNMTVLAPSNAAVAALPRKPWEDPEDQDEELYRGQEGEDRATRNLRRFVEAHCVQASPWPRGVKARTVEGVELWWEAAAEGDGKRTIMPQGVEVLQVKDDVANGQLWIIDGVVNYKP